MSRIEDTNWGAQARGWAENWGRLADPAREAVLKNLEIEAGTLLLDIGCGSGEFLNLARSHGATISGVDSGEGMISLSRSRLPAADLRVGDAVRLPWDDKSFDVVTAFNALQFTDDFLAALGEARRVTRPGGRVAVCNWGRLEDCDLKPVFDALDEAQGGDPPAEDPPLPLGEPGELELLARGAGLEPTVSEEVDVPYEVPDRDALYRALLLDAALHGIEGKEADKAALAATEVAAPFKRDDGSYRFENRFRYIVATTG